LYGKVEDGEEAGNEDEPFYECYGWWIHEGGWDGCVGPAIISFYLGAYFINKKPYEVVKVRKGKPTRLFINHDNLINTG